MPLKRFQGLTATPRQARKELTPCLPEKRVSRESESQSVLTLSERSNADFPTLDEVNHRLFIGCRNPAKLLVLDMGTGKTIATLDIVGDTDDLFYDAANKRIYVSGGEGRVTVISQTNPNTYNVAGQVATAPGARTSFLVPETGTLYVAVPHRGAQKAELRAFTVVPAK